MRTLAGDTEGRKTMSQCLGEDAACLCTGHKHDAITYTYSGAGDGGAEGWRDGEEGRAGGGRGWRDGEEGWAGGGRGWRDGVEIGQVEVE